MQRLLRNDRVYTGSTGRVDLFLRYSLFEILLHFHLSNFICSFFKDHLEIRHGICRLVTSNAVLTLLDSIPSNSTFQASLRSSASIDLTLSFTIKDTQVDVLTSSNSQISTPRDQTPLFQAFLYSFVSIEFYVIVIHKSINSIANSQIISGSNSSQLFFVQLHRSSLSFKLINFIINVRILK